MTLPHLAAGIFSRQRVIPPEPPPPAVGDFVIRNALVNPYALDVAESVAGVDSWAGLNVTDKLAVEAHVYFPGTPGAGNVISRWSAGNILWGLSRGTSIWRGYMRIGGAEREVQSAALTLVAGQRYHVAIHYDGAVLSLVVDGRVEGTVSIANTIATGPDPFLIGGQIPTPVQRLPGVVDEVRIWGGATIPSLFALRRDRTKRLVGNETGLLWYSRLDSDSGRTVFDLAGGRHGRKEPSGTGWTDETAFAQPVATHNEHPIVYRNADLPTPDAAGQVVHTSVVYWPGGFGPDDHEWHMAHTPYTDGDEGTELVCYVTAASPEGPWVVPTGGENPIVDDGVVDGDVYLGRKDDELFAFWLRTPGTGRFLYWSKSSDGLSWSTPALSFTETTEHIGVNDPQVDWDGTQWVWHNVTSVTSGTAVLRRRTSSDLATWSSPTDLTINDVPSGYFLYHSEVRPAGGGRWDALFGFATAHGGTNARNYYGWSTDDGDTFTVAPDRLSIPRIYDERFQYKPAFLHDPGDPGLFLVWASGGRGSGLATWWTAFLTQERVGNALFDVRPTDATMPPDAPGAFALSQASGQNTLTWTDPPSLTAVRIYRGTAKHSMTLLATVDPTDDAYVDGSLTNGTPYFYALETVDGDRVSGWTSILRGTPGAINPATLSPALWAAPSALTEKQGASAGTLPDVSGNGYNASSQTALTVDSTWRGAHALRFNGSTSRAEFGTQVAKPSSYTQFVILRKDTLASRRCAVASADSGGGGARAWGSLIVDTSGRVEYAFGSGAAASDGRTTATVITAGQVHLVTKRYTSGQNAEEIWVDGDSKAITTTATGASSVGGTNEPLVIGRYGAYAGSTNLYWNGEVGDMLIIPSALSDANREGVEWWLMDKNDV